MPVPSANAGSFFTGAGGESVGLMKDRKGLLYPPHIHDWRTNTRIMRICILSLLPVVVWSIVLYGRRAFFVWSLAPATAFLSQIICDFIKKKQSFKDGSAILTGLIIAATMPPTIPLYIPILASIFAIIIVKEAFGGFGSNWMNPALGGTAFAFLNWPIAMREFILPRFVSGVDGISASTPLAFAKGLAQAGYGSVMETISQAGYPVSGIDRSISSFLNDWFFDFLGAKLPEGYIDLAIGLKPGVLGESGLILLIIASLVLLSKRIIKAEIPFTMLFVFMLLSRFLGTGLPGESLMNGDVLYALAGGGIFMGAFFSATDPVTSPVSRPLTIIYGALIGALCYIFRRWGSYMEGTCFAILLANMLVPSMEARWIKLRRLAV